MPTLVEVEVQLYAIARERAGSTRVLVSLAGDSTVADLRKALGVALPAIADILPSSLIAQNGEYATDDQRIVPDQELAVIPPVSGGQGDSSDDEPDWIEITEQSIEPGEVCEFARSRRAGAVCLFLGTVREFTGERQTTCLDYEAYESMALKSMRELAEQARSRWPVLKLALVHRVGRLELGEVSVAVAVSCPHRDASFEAGRWLIDTLKQVVPIWKKEEWADGRVEWVHPGLSSPPPLASPKQAAAD